MYKNCIKFYNLQNTVKNLNQRPTLKKNLYNYTNVSPDGVDEKKYIFIIDFMTKILCV